MLAQLCNVTGLTARVEGSDVLATSNVFRLEITGVNMVCLSYLDPSNAAHIRYAVDRIRRKLPRAIMILGCWSPEDATARLETLRKGTKADLICSSLRDATQLCIDAAKNSWLDNEYAKKSQSDQLKASFNLT